MAVRERTPRGLGKQFKSEYTSWHCMMTRCLNPNHEHYHNYGGGGIAVCERWLSFARFLLDMGTKPDGSWTIERKNTDGDYCPDNCRWATQSEQTENQRRSRHVTFEGRTQSAGKWAKEVGMNRGTLIQRVFDMGLDAAEALQPKPRIVTERTLTCFGKTMRLFEWERETGIPAQTILARIGKLRWTLKKALSTPPGKNGRKRAAAGVVRG